MTTPLPEGLPPLTCKCGWKGTHKEAELFACAGDTRTFCPRCYDNGYMVTLRAALPPPEKDAKTEGKTPIEKFKAKWDRHFSPQKIIDQLETTLAESRAEIESLTEKLAWTEMNTADHMFELNTLRKKNKKLRDEAENARQDHQQADTDSLRALHERNELREENKRLRDVIQNLLPASKRGHAHARTFSESQEFWDAIKSAEQVLNPPEGKAGGMNQETMRGGDAI